MQCIFLKIITTYLSLTCANVTNITLCKLEKIITINMQRYVHSPIHNKENMLYVVTILQGHLIYLVAWPSPLPNCIIWFTFQTCSGNKRSFFTICLNGVCSTYLLNYLYFNSKINYQKYVHSLNFAIVKIDSINFNKLTTNFTVCSRNAP